MKTRCLSFRFGPAVLAVFAWACAAPGQPGPEFQDCRRLPNGEVWLGLRTFGSPLPGVLLRLEACADLAAPDWTPLANLWSAGPCAWADAGAPFAPVRFYRAWQFETTNRLAGDCLQTTNGEVVIQPFNHASFLMTWAPLGDRAICVDPAANTFPGRPRAGLVLFTHNHSDHFNSANVSTVITATAPRLIVAPASMTNSLPTALKACAAGLTNGAATNWQGIQIEAVPMYNLSSSYHPRGAGNGYVLTLGGRRLYLAGDTEDTPEMRALTNIDLAFLPMNRPYTMTVSQAVAAVRAFRPKVVYPYHYLNSDNTYADTNAFKTQVATNPGTEVRLRNWY